MERLKTSYPAASREALEVALRSNWKIGMSDLQAIAAAEAALPSEYQWPRTGLTTKTHSGLANAR
jgi:hypothetical protein